MKYLNKTFVMGVISLITLAFTTSAFAGDYNPYHKPYHKPVKHHAKECIGTYLVYEAPTDEADGDDALSLLRDGDPRRYLLITLHLGGTVTVTVSDNAGDAISPQQHGDLHGAWKRTGHRKAKSTAYDFNYYPGAPNGLAFMLRVDTEFEFSRDCSMANGQAAARIYPADFDPFGDGLPIIDGIPGAPGDPPDVFPIVGKRINAIGLP